MPTTAVIATTVTTPTDRSLSVFVGYKDLTSDIQWDSLRIEDSGANVKGTTAFRINAAIADLPDVYDQAFVQVIDHDTDALAFSGFVASRRPRKSNKLEKMTEVIANDIGGLLDDAWIPSEVRPAESMQARLGYLWGAYAGSYLSPHLAFVASIGGTLPAASYVGVTLRTAIEQVIAQASSSADYYVDMAGRLHVFTSETNDAPFNIDADAPGAGEIAPQHLDIDYESASYANRVYIQGGTPAGSGFFQDGAAIAAANGVVRTASYAAQDCETAAMALALASMYLGRVSSSKPRGTFTTTSPDVGFRGGQNVLITSADHDLSAESFKIARATTTVVRPGTSPALQQEVEFGGARAGSGGGISGSVGQGQLVSGQLGGASNAYVNSDGVQVTDNTTVRVYLGRLPSGDYGLKVVNAGATVIIDGTSNMFKIAATGTVNIAGPNGTATDAAITTGGATVATGLTYIVAFLQFLDSGGGYATALGFAAFLDADFDATWKAGKVVRNVWGRSSVVGGNQSRIEWDWQAWTNDSALTWGFRYYMLSEAAF